LVSENAIHKKCSNRNFTHEDGENMTGNNTVSAAPKINYPSINIKELDKDILYK
jgi:hypothetical protein